MTQPAVAELHDRPAVSQRDERFRFNLRELSGSLGDMGTFLPLTLAMALASGMDLGLIFIFAGLMNVVTGFWFGQPLPVQPMKAIAAVAITEGLTAGAIASAGLTLGVALVALAMVGAVDWIGRSIPRPVVRGIQLGIGLKLAWSGLAWCSALPTVGWDSWLIAIIVVAVLALSAWRQWPVLVGVFLAGFILLGIAHPSAYGNWSIVWPRFHVVVPTANEWWMGMTRGSIPQLPLTLLNSVIAVCALSGDYFPGRGIAPRRMAVSVGLMNLLCVPFGGMPMCHGAGGLAAQHHFGARTGGSVIMLGTMKIVAGLLLAGPLASTLRHYPRSILAVLILFAGMTLASAARDCLRRPHLLILIATAGPILLWNTLAGVLLGIAIAGSMALLRARRERHEH